jgi:hypothetical protein
LVRRESQIYGSDPIVVEVIAPNNREEKGTINGTSKFIDAKPTFVTFDDEASPRETQVILPRKIVSSDDLAMNLCDVCCIVFD